MIPDSIFDRANAIVSAFQKELRDADAIAKNPRIREIHARSRNLQEQDKKSSQGIADILTAADADGLMNDPDFRKQMQEVSARLNSTSYKCL